MGRHVIVSLIIVDKLRIAFWNQVVDKGLEVFSHRRICIFIDGQSGRGMLDKYMKDTRLDLSHFRKMPFYQMGYQMKSPRKGFEAYGFLDGHEYN